MNKQILNPLGMVGSVEQRPAIYLPSLNDQELITYSESFAGTKLETELTKRLVLALDGKNAARTRRKERRRILR